VTCRCHYHQRSCSLIHPQPDRSPHTAPCRGERARLALQSVQLSPHIHNAAAEWFQVPHSDAHTPTARPFQSWSDLRALHEQQRMPTSLRRVTHPDSTHACSAQGFSSLSHTDIYSRLARPLPDQHKHTPQTRTGHAVGVACKALFGLSPRVRHRHTT
jgi:hypothetical protein